MITVYEAGDVKRVYHGVSLKFSNSEQADFNVLVTWSEDGELNFVYCRECTNRQDVINYIADTSAGTIESIKFWNLSFLTQGE